MTANTQHVHVTYGTINDMIVELPNRPYNVIELMDAFATAFVKYMTTGCLTSDECLFSSIGESQCRKAMVEGIKARTEDKAVRDIFIKSIMDDHLWKGAILKARYGLKEATIRQLTDIYGDREKAEQSYELMFK